MDVKLNDEQLQKALDAAILTAIGETGKEEIIKQAVAHLTKKESASIYDRTPVSPLMRIMGDAADDIARAILTKRLKEDVEFVAEIEKLYADAVRKMFHTETREKLVDKLAGAMAKALADDR